MTIFSSTRIILNHFTSHIKLTKIAKLIFCIMSIDDHLNSEIEFIPCVVSYLIKDDKVLLGLRKKVENQLGQNIIAGFGGKVGDLEEFRDEDYHDALARELREEIQVDINEYDYRGRIRLISPANPKWCLDIKVYIIHSWQGEPKETDYMKPDWYHKEALPTEQMWQDNRVWVPMVLQGERVDMVFLYDEDGDLIDYRSVSAVD